MRRIALLGIFSLATTLGCVAKKNKVDQGGGEPSEEVSSTYSTNSIPQSKISGSSLRLTDATVAKTAISNEAEGLSISAAKPDNAEFIEYMVCSTDSGNCSDIGTFVKDGDVAISIPKGPTKVKMRACVDPSNATNPAENCGPWSEEYVLQQTDNESLKQVLVGYDSTIRDLKQECKEMHNNLQSDAQNANLSAEEQSIAANLANYFTPEVCAAFAASEDAEQAVEQASENSDRKELTAGVVLAGVGTTAGIAGLATAGFAMYKVRGMVPAATYQELYNAKDPRKYLLDQKAKSQDVIKKFDEIYKKAPIPEQLDNPAKVKAKMVQYEGRLSELSKVQKLDDKQVQEVERLTKDRKVATDLLEYYEARSNLDFWTKVEANNAGLIAEKANALKQRDSIIERYKSLTGVNPGEKLPTEIWTKTGSGNIRLLQGELDAANKKLTDLNIKLETRLTDAKLVKAVDDLEAAQKFLAEQEKLYKAALAQKDGSATRIAKELFNWTGGWVLPNFEVNTAEDAERAFAQAKESLRGKKAEVDEMSKEIKKLQQEAEATSKRVNDLSQRLSDRTFIASIDDELAKNSKRLADIDASWKKAMPGDMSYNSTKGKWKKAAGIGIAIGAIGAAIAVTGIVLMTKSQEEKLGLAGNGSFAEKYNAQFQRILDLGKRAREEHSNALDSI